MRYLALLVLGARIGAAQTVPRETCRDPAQELDCTSPDGKGGTDCWAGSESEPCTCSNGRAKLTGTTMVLQVLPPALPMPTHPNLRRRACHGGAPWEGGSTSHTTSGLNPSTRTPVTAPITGHHLPQLPLLPRRQRRGWRRDNRRRGVRAVQLRLRPLPSR